MLAFEPLMTSVAQRSPGKERKMMIAKAIRARETARCVVLVVSLGATAWGCPRGGSINRDDNLYTHGRIHVDKKTVARWDAGEKDATDAGDKIQPIKADDGNPQTVPTKGDAGATLAKLAALKPSERHGATDKRMLSVLGERNTFQGSGIIAQIALVKGSEYKSEGHFRQGWIPIAIIVVPDSLPAGKVFYPKLELHGGTSWLYVREESPSKWDAALLRIADGKIEQDSLHISVASDDNLEPVIGAQFYWQEDDETVWAYCGGNCCKVVNPR
jgi:hypothetical protein